MSDLRRSLYAIFSLLLLSCSPKAPQGNQNSGPIARSYALFRLGVAERILSERNQATCLFDEMRSELVVTFSDAESGTSFSVRLFNVNPQRNLHALDSVDSGENLLVNAGGDLARNTFRFVPVPMASYQAAGAPSCRIAYRISPGELFGSFQCSGLANGLGQSQVASGEWSCRMQSEQEWGW